MISKEKITSIILNYFNEKKNNEIMRRNIKAVETFVILKEIFKRNEIQWALLDITNRIEKSQSNNFTIIIAPKIIRMEIPQFSIVFPHNSFSNIV